MPGSDCPFVASRYLAREMIFCAVPVSAAAYMASSIPDTFHEFRYNIYSNKRQHQKANKRRKIKGF